MPHSTHNAIKEVDPINPGEHQALIDSLLNEGFFTWLGRKKSSVYFQGITYTVSQDGKKQIKLKHCDLKYSPETNTYRLISHEERDKIGSGFFIAAQRIVGKLRLDKKGHWVYHAPSGRRPPLLARIYDHVGLRKKGYNESALTTKTTAETEILHHLDPRLKDTVVSATHPKQGNTKSYVVAREVPGKDLYTLREKEKRGDIPRIPAAKKLLVSINLLRALQRLHAQDVYHRDIKTNNVIADLETGTVELVDYNSAKLTYNSLEMYYGFSWQYAAPELAFDSSGVADNRSDLYSAGLVLLEWWGGRGRARPGAPISYQELFAGIADMQADEQAQVSQVIRDVLADSPDERCTLGNAIERLEQVRLRQGNADIQAAYKLAQRIRTQLEEVEYGKKDGEPLSIILQNIEALTDSPEAIHEFLNTLDVKALQRERVDSKANIIARATQIINNFAIHWQSVQELQAKIDDLTAFTDCLLLTEKQKLRYLTVAVGALLNKRNKYRNKLDDFAELDQRLVSRLELLWEKIAIFERKTMLETRVPLWRAWHELREQMHNDLLFVDLKFSEAKNLRRWLQEMDNLQLKDCINSSQALAEILKRFQKNYAIYAANRKPDMETKIYPKKLTPDTSYLLSQLFTQREDQLEFNKGLYDVFIPDRRNSKKKLKIKVELKQQIKSRYHGTELRYDIIEEIEQGSGASAVVHPIKYTLIPHYHALRIKRKAKADKSFKVPLELTQEMPPAEKQEKSQRFLTAMQNECRVLQADPDLHAKDLVVQYNAAGEIVAGRQVMSLIAGKSLDKVIDSGCLPSDDECLTIFVNLALDLQRMHRNLNLVHRDVKLENVIVKPNGGVKVVDFGHTMFNGQNAGRLAGSICAAAIESFLGQPLTQQSDIYSAGIIFFELLTAQSQNARLRRIKAEEQSGGLVYDQQAQQNMNVKFAMQEARLREIFEVEGELIRWNESEIAIPGFSADELETLKNLIEAMMDPIAAKRSNWERVISTLRQLQLNREIRRLVVDEPTAKAMRDAHELAVRIHTELTAAALNRTDPLRRIDDIIDGAMSDLGPLSHPAVLQIFLKVIDVAVFKDALDIDTVRQRAHTIIFDYHEHLKQINQLQQQLEIYLGMLDENISHFKNYHAIKKSLSEQLALTKALAAKYTKPKQRAITFDNLHAFNEGFANEMGEISETLEKLKKKHSFVILTSHAQILTRLQGGPSPQDGIAQLKNNVRTAVAEYKTYLDSTERKLEVRAERYKNMNAVLEVINDETIREPAKLRKEVDRVLSGMNRRTLGFFGHSVFCKKVRTAVHSKPAIGGAADPLRLVRATSK
jgi:serine/threonine protein kinase